MSDDDFTNTPSGREPDFTITRDGAKLMSDDDFTLPITPAGLHLATPPPSMAELLLVTQHMRSLGVRAFTWGGERVEFFDRAPRPADDPFAAIDEPMPDTEQPRDDERDADMWAASGYEPVDLRKAREERGA